MKTEFWVRILAKPNTLLDSSLHSTLACFTNFLLKACNGNTSTQYNSIPVHLRKVQAC